MSDEVLFLRGAGQNSGSLDDTLLLDCYDKHFNNVKTKVLRRMGYNGSEIDNILKVSHKQKKSTQQKQGHKWSVGAHCRSVFGEDGNTYEATVTEVMADKDACRVRYVGYDNEEEVAASSLTQSLGRKAREAQSYAAAGSEAPDMDESAPTQSSKKHKRHWTSPPRSMSEAPPVMPSMVPPMPFNMTAGNGEQTEAFSAMLMSWYMSGYYTGYYEALNTRRKPHK